MKLRFRQFNLELRHRFTVSGFSRTETPGIQVEIEHDGIVGYGEASMPQYLGESVESVSSFLSKVNLEQFNDPFLLEDILEYIDSVAPENTAAKASVDIALHDLTGKIAGMPCYRMFGLNPVRTPLTTYTIGIDTEEKLRQKIEEVGGRFKMLKIKIGTADDKVIISAVRKVTDLPLSVDANQGWRDREEALDLIFWLEEHGVKFIEQPMPKDRLDDMAWLTERSPLPLFADESVKRLSDMQRINGAFSGVNIKLMKCTGMREALKMIHAAKAMNMKVMLGCMTETSCAISAAAQLSPLADIADLDGNLLISNDIFDGVKVVDGRLALNELPGIGVMKKDNI